MAADANQTLPNKLPRYKLLKFECSLFSQADGLYQGTVLIKSPVPNLAKHSPGDPGHQKIKVIISKVVLPCLISFTAPQTTMNLDLFL